MITGNESIQQAIYRQTGEESFRIATPFDLADRTIQHYISSKPGLTIRQHFAAMAMQGLLSNPEWMKEYKGEKYKMQDSVVAEVSCKQADALIAELNNNPTP